MADINYRIILRIIGVLLWLEALSMLLPLAVALYYGEHDINAFLLTIGIAVASGSILFFQYSNKERKTLGKRDGIMVVTLCWIFFSLVGSLPFIFSGSVENLAGAFFETVSGVTGTGASIIPDVEKLPHGILMWRSLIQWLGGLGIILFTLALLPLLNSGGSIQLFNADTTGIMKDKLGPRIGQTAKLLWTTYLGVTLVLTALLYMGPMNLFDALCHAFTTCATGGFSTKNASVAYWNSAYIEYVITAFMLISGINYALVYRAIRGEVKKTFGNEEVKWYLIIVAVFTILITIGLFFNGVADKLGIEATIRAALFQVASTITSTGYITADFVAWGPFFCILICLLMFCGGCAGSTSGGAKVIRIVVLLKNTIYEFYRQVHPNAIVPVRINQQAISHEIVSKILAFLFTYVFIVIIGALALATMGLTIDEAFGCSLSCIGNIGTGLGRTLYSFAIIPDAGKWILSFIMLVGRLEIFTVLILFTPYFWKK